MTKDFVNILTGTYVEYVPVAQNRLNKRPWFRIAQDAPSHFHNVGSVISVRDGHGRRKAIVVKESITHDLIEAIFLN